MYPIARLVAVLHEYLQQQTEPVGEYQLIQQLDKQQAFAAADGLSAPLRLFHKHFVTMHCLYTLQRQVYPQWLQVSPLAIQLYAFEAPAAGDSALGQGSALAEFYLDIHHLHEATEESVATLLGQFWQRFDAAEGAEEAFAVLGLKPSATWGQVKHAYRQKAQQAHPDKGGSEAHFAQVRDAFLLLKQHLTALD